MTGPENIFGGRGCQLPDGKLCRACCYSLEIREPRLHKGAGQECPHESDQGCGIHKHPDLYPHACDRFHCNIFIDGRHTNETHKAVFVAARGIQLGYVNYNQYLAILDKVAQANGK